MGAVRQTTQSLTVVSVDLEKNLMLVKGAVPGARGGNILVKPAVKG
jgi:large subunit ribosomal protein L3